jgi:hypothetical protein
LGNIATDLNNTRKNATISYSESKYVTQTWWVRGQGRTGKIESSIQSLLRNREEEEEEFLNCTNLIDGMAIELNNDITYLARESKVNFPR